MHAARTPSSSVANSERLRRMDPHHHHTLLQRDVSQASISTRESRGRQRSMSASSCRSRSSGTECRVAFGATVQQPGFTGWSSRSYLEHSPRGPNGTTSSTTVVVDDLCSVDSLTMGSAVGSVRLERHVPPGRNPKLLQFIAPYSLRQPVTVVLEKATLTVMLTGTSAAVVCAVPLENLTMVSSSASGTLKISYKGGGELHLSIHNPSKLNLLRKIIQRKCPLVQDDRSSLVSCSRPSTSMDNRAFSPPRVSAINGRLIQGSPGDYSLGAHGCNNVHINFSKPKGHRVVKGAVAEPIIEPLSQKQLEDSKRCSVMRCGGDSLDRHARKEVILAQLKILPTT